MANRQKCQSQQQIQQGQISVKMGVHSMFQVAQVNKSVECLSTQWCSHKGNGDQVLKQCYDMANSA